MATRYTMVGAAATVTAAVAAALVAMSGGERAQSLGLTQHGALITAQDAGAADAVATVAVSPGTPGQVLTVSDAGLPHWAAAASSSSATTLYASDCIAEAGSESASISGTGSTSTLTLTASSTSRAYGTSGATAARVVCVIPAGAREIDVTLGPITAVTGLTTGGYRFVTLALRDAANSGAPAYLWGASFNDSSGSSEVYWGSLMGGGNSPGTYGGVTHTPTATDVWLRVALRPLLPLVTVSTGLGVSSARPSAWFPIATPGSGMTLPGGAYGIADTASATAVVVALQSYGSGGASSITARLSVRVTQ